MTLSHFADKPDGQETDGIPLVLVKVRFMFCRKREATSGVWAGGREIMYNLTLEGSSF